MKFIKKILPTIAAAAIVTAYPLCASAFTPQNSGHGTFSNEKISGTGATVFMYNHSGSYSKCYVNIFYWGSPQTGKVQFDLHRADGDKHWYHTFNSCGEVYLMEEKTKTNSSWTLDAKCINKNINAHRTISGEWRMS